MSDFSDRPFVAGSLTGVRVFDVDSLGRLRGPSIPRIFKPGENVAECEGGALTRSLHRQMMALSASLGSPVTTFDPPPSPPPKAPHIVGVASCSCGFYAYYDMGSNPHDGPGKVTALIEGYGVCSVGTRGFRAEKARLLALVLPSSARTHPAWFDRLADRSHRGGWASLVGVIAIMAGLICLPAGVGLLSEGHLAGGLLLPLGVALGAVTRVMWKADFHGLDRQYPTIRDLSRCSDHGALPADGLIRRAYPEVPVYRTLKAALADHPLTVPPAPTPDDDDFWTRP